MRPAGRSGDRILQREQSRVDLGHIAHQQRREQGQQRIDGCGHAAECCADIGRRAAEMLAERKSFAYPPFVRMIAITVKDRYEGRVWNVCRLIREAAGQAGITDIAGPVVPAVDVVAGEHIAQFWIKLPRSRTSAGLKRALYERIQQIERDFKGHTTITLDVDPF